MGARWRRILRGETAEALGPRLGRRLFGMVPSGWRCKFCNAPFDGPFSPAFRLIGYTASRKNPHVCARCIETAPDGGAVVPVSVLFADIRGYTTIAERQNPLEVTATVRRFYECASSALLRHEAVLATIAGDAVMALFLPGFAGAAYPRRGVEGALALLRAVGYGSDSGNWIDVGVGISTGEDYVGNVGGGGFKDFTALGDATNTAARLQANAGGGEIILDQPTYAAVADSYADAQRLELILKGKDSPVACYRISCLSPASSRSS
jgi:adenylate cyclase